jgi:regulator of protease activity HflC (stomatin/prohibitin superfamily)
MGIEGLLNLITTWGLTITGLCLGLWVLSKILVNVGADQIAVAERRFIGMPLEGGRVFALPGRIGMQARYLPPGLHFIAWPLVTVTMKPHFLVINADELGIVEATDGVPLPAGRIFADDASGSVHNNFQDPVAFLTRGGVRGKQLRFLTNGAFKIHPLLFKVTKIKKTFIPEGAIGVITALDGEPLMPGQLLGRSVDNHESFQRAEDFLKNGGQKGPQTDFLRPGTYNINTEIFKVELHEAVQIPEKQIGIIEALDGAPMDSDEVVASTPDGHNNFQNSQAFLDNGGKRGPQEKILTPGTYYINPYLFTVTLQPQTMIEQGEVGVMISNVGKDPSHLSFEGVEMEADDRQHARYVVPAGYRGIQKDVLGPGAYNINPLAYRVVVIQTRTRSLDWSADKQNRSPDVQIFQPFQVVSHDGFPMQIEVRCQYRIQPQNAPYIVQKLGSIRELESNVIHPQIDGIFRAQVSRSPAISYQQNRAEEQKAAEEAVRKDLTTYRVDVVSVMITNIVLPEELMRTTQQKNLAEQEKSMFDAKQQAELRRIEFEKTKTEADSQVAIITAEAGIKVAQHEARQVEERARGDANRIRMLAEADAMKTQQVGDAEAGVIQTKGEAQAKAYRDQVDALTAQGVTTVEVMKSIAGAGLKITPDIQVSGNPGGAGDSAGLVQVLLAQMVRKDPPAAA